MFTFAPFCGREGDPGRSGRHASPGHYENADGIRNAAAKRVRYLTYQSKNEVFCNHFKQFAHDIKEKFLVGYDGKIFKF